MSFVAQNGWGVVDCGPRVVNEHERVIAGVGPGDMAEGPANKENHMVESVVTTGAGRVRGVRVDSPAGPVETFLAIPYAEAPAGDRRWRPPVRRAPWPDILDATTHGAAARQPVGELLDGLVPGMDVGRQGDDCLHVSVWTPATDGGRRPVVVWVHGGAFTMGAPSLAVYDGARLAAEQDLVVVNVGYRLGALGFLSIDDPSCTPNVGLLDQVEALRWVRREIDRFGGDPGRVTVFGESAGGGSVLSLLSMPAAAGLFHRAIVQSGATDLLLDRDRARLVAEAFVRHAGTPDGDLNALRRLPAEAVLAAQHATAEEVFATVGTMPFHPCVDGEVITRSWDEAARSGIDPVALLLGTTADEMGLFAAMDPKAATLDDAGLVRRLGYLGLDAPAVTAAYAEVDVTDPPAVWRRVQTDTQMWIPALRLAEARSAHAPVFVYRFDWPAGPGASAVHGVDIPFPFGTTEQWAGFLHDLDGAAALSTTVRALWASFARTGDPSVGGIEWPRHEPGRRATLLLDADPRVVDDLDAPVRQTLDTGPT